MAYAVTGRLVDGLGLQDRPDVESLLDDLERLEPGARAAITRRAAESRAAGEPWPGPVPKEVRTGLGHAQLSAALTELARRLPVGQPGPVRLTTDRGLSDAERRLVEDRPPHHGS